MASKRQKRRQQERKEERSAYAQCGNKQRHETPVRAKRHASHLHMQSGRKEYFNVYRCRQCDFFHVGHKSTKDIARYAELVMRETIDHQQRSKPSRRINGVPERQLVYMRSRAIERERPYLQDLDESCWYWDLTTELSLYAATVGA